MVLHFVAAAESPECHGQLPCHLSKMPSSPEAQGVLMPVIPLANRKRMTPHRLRAEVVKRRKCHLSRFCVVYVGGGRHEVEQAIYAVKVIR